VNGKLQHPEYLANWIKVLRDDDKAFMKAASLAQAATDFILAASDDDDHEDEGEDSAAA
jgi:antirestriction protein ArdC